MGKYEDVFDALRHCVTGQKCGGCPRDGREPPCGVKTDVPVALGLDVLNLLKEQREEADRMNGMLRIMFNRCIVWQNDELCRLCTLREKCKVTRNGTLTEGNAE